MTPEQERAAYPFALNRRCLSSSKSRARSAFNGSAFSASAAICASSLARRARSAGVRWSGIALDCLSVCNTMPERKKHVVGLPVSKNVPFGPKRLVFLVEVTTKTGNMLHAALEHFDNFVMLLGLQFHVVSPLLMTPCNAKPRYVSNGKKRYGENNSGDHLKEQGQ